MSGTEPADPKPTRSTRSKPSSTAAQAADTADQATKSAATRAPKPRAAAQPPAAAAVSDAAAQAGDAAAQAVTEAAEAVAAPVAPVAPVAETPVPAAAAGVAAATAEAATAPAGQAAPPAQPRPAGPDIGAALGRLSDQLRERLSPAEMVLGVGALLIVVVAWALFGVILGEWRAFPPDLVLLGGAALLFLLWLQNTGTRQFGANYRLAIGAIGLVVGVLTAAHIISTLRLSGLSGATLGMLGWWVGGALVALGAWMHWREPA